MSVIIVARAAPINSNRGIKITFNVTLKIAIKMADFNKKLSCLFAIILAEKTEKIIRKNFPKTSILNAIKEKT